VMPKIKAVLAPCLFELMTENESEIKEWEHLVHLQDVLKFISQLNIENRLNAYNNMQI